MRISDWSSDCALPIYRALFWPRHGALIVADLHLEKASWYAALGQPLPPYDSHDTLDRLAALADQTGARAIWCLGDSFHDRNAATRIVPAVAERLARQAASARLLWIAGNHDGRSEEHTSELQSLMRISYAVFCLKKKTNTPICEQ